MGRKKERKRERGPSDEIVLVDGSSILEKYKEKKRKKEEKR